MRQAENETNTDLQSERNSKFALDGFPKSALATEALASIQAMQILIEDRFGGVGDEHEALAFLACEARAKIEELMGAANG